MFSVRAQPGGGGQHRAGGLAAEPCSHRLGGGDDQGVQLPLPDHGGFDRGLADGQHLLQRVALQAGLRLGQSGSEASRYC